MTTLGEKALELIRESVRAQDMLGPFNEDKVRSVLEEIRTLYSEVSLYDNYASFLDTFCKTIHVVRIMQIL